MNPPSPDPVASSDDLQLPAELAARLDVAAYLAGHDAPGPRRRALRQAAALEAAAGSLDDARANLLRTELADLRLVAAAGRVRHRRALVGRLGNVAGSVLLAPLALLLFDIFWITTWQPPDLPLVFQEPGAPDRTAFYVTALAPGTQAPDPGAARGEALGALEPEEEASPTPPPEEDPLAQASAEVAPPPEEPSTERAPPAPEEPDDAPLAEVEAEPQPPVEGQGSRTLAKMVAKVAPPPTTTKAPEAEQPEIPDEGEDDAVADLDLGGATARIEATPPAPAPRTQPTAPPLPLGPLLESLGLPELQVGQGPRVLALRSDAPMAFASIGPADAARRERRDAFGLDVARTEVTQKQWATVMDLDLASISGQWENPAEAMSWCEALRFANALSKREGLRPPYRLDRECEYGGEVRWDTEADGFRLLTEAEWLALASTMKGTDPGAWDPGTPRVNNRGMYDVAVGVESDPLQVVGLADNAREWIWGVDRRPPEVDGDKRARFQEHSGAWPRSVVRGCTSTDPAAAEAMARMRQGIDQATDLTCRDDPPPASVPIGVGLRLARGKPAES